jgi:cell division protein FtsI/penicillin-binding protein 2
MINKKKFKNKEFVLGIFFGILLLVIVARLFFLQILEASYYKKLLFFQHYKMYLLSPQRGNIYIENQTGNKIALTQNVSLFDIFVDPKFIPDKQKFIDIITPYIYKHLCKKH